MRHVPHVLIPSPWQGDRLAIPDETLRHLRTVLRADVGAPVSYTDGAGLIGEGHFTGDALHRRGERFTAAPTPEIVLATAPPKARERARFLVEKAGELGVSELRWLRTRHGEGRPPKPEKAHRWAVGALEQSRGAWLMQIGAPMALAELAADPGGPVLVADPSGSPVAAQIADLGDPTSILLVIGPEGGFADGEIPEEARVISLGDQVLRVETAAVAAVASIRLR